MNEPILIRVRHSTQTYTASAAGKRASATAGHRQAAERLAEKLAEPGTCELCFAGIDNSDPARAVHCYKLYPNP